MKWSIRQQLGARAVSCAMIAAAVAFVPQDAEAFEVKHGTHGEGLRWNKSQIAFVIDPSIEDAVKGGADAVARAAGVWSATGGAPALSTTSASRPSKPALDGQNTILYAEDFAPAGNALAVTVTSYDDSTGNIVDVDVVVNGNHSFSVLPAGARAADGVSAVATDGGQSDKEGSKHAAPFDFQHVVTHEVGHALGLGDVRDGHSAVMYAYSAPGDASVRVLSTDDVDGINAIYGGTAMSASAPSSGCGQASVAGAHTRTTDGLVAMALVAGVGVRLLSRRRRRVLLPIGAVMVALLVSPDSARSASPAPGAMPVTIDATARVISASTRDVGGVFQTTFQLAPATCRVAPCPAHVLAQAWGGTIGGITQQVADQPVPKVGDVVDVAYPHVASNIGLALAYVVAVHP
ncbi:MAG: matrixin family metalloprotease [Myxococcota bacterium]|nr:matrixin family metalloprotease [Myxococcota bacterium]